MLSAGLLLGVDRQPPRAGVGVHQSMRCAGRQQDPVAWTENDPFAVYLELGASVEKHHPLVAALAEVHPGRAVRRSGSARSECRPPSGPVRRPALPPRDRGEDLRDGLWSRRSWEGEANPVRGSSASASESPFGRDGMRRSEVSNGSNSKVGLTAGRSNFFSDFSGFRHPRSAAVPKQGA